MVLKSQLALGLLLFCQPSSYTESCSSLPLSEIPLPSYSCVLLRAAATSGFHSLINQSTLSISLVQAVAIVPWICYVYMIRDILLKGGDYLERLDN